MTRMSAPGLFSTRREINCSMSDPILGGHRLRRTQHHFIDGASGRNHRIDVFKRRDAHVEQIRTGLGHGGFERGAQLTRASRPCCP